MKNIKVKTLEVGMLETNCYIVRKDGLKEVVVVDPGDSVEKILQYLEDNELLCKGILLTHGHFDHIMAATALAELTNAPIYAHEEEEQLLQSSDLNCTTLVRKRFVLTPDIKLKDQENLSLANLKLQVIHTPGHTIGGVCYYIPDHKILISGDTLFKESIGNTSFPTGDGRTLLNSIQTKLMNLPEDVQVYPGHGEPTTIGHERVNNPYLR